MQSPVFANESTYAYLRINAQERFLAVIHTGDKSDRVPLGKNMQLACEVGGKAVADTATLDVSDNIASVYRVP